MLFTTIILSLLLIVGCSNGDKEETYIGDLILSKDKIDLVWIDEGNNPAFMIKNKEFIAKLLLEASDITVFEMSIEQEKDFLPKIKDHPFTLIDFHEEDSNNPAYGRLLIWEDGTILTVDITTDQSANRTVLYLALNEYPDLYQWIRNDLEVLKNN